MIRKVSKYAFALTAALLTLGILVLGTFLVLVAVPDLTDSTAVVEPTPAPSPTATPKSAMALSPVGISMPADTNCNACHMTTTGTVGTKDIPVMAHPLLGWRDCTACHSTGSLVKTAAGHSSLHKDECLICHKTQAAAGTASSAPLRPEHMGTGKQCTDCHGMDQHAPMPADMAGRGNNCWICHNGSEFTYLFEASPSPGASPAQVEPAAPSASGAPSASPADGAGVGYILGAGSIP